MFFLLSNMFLLTITIKISTKHIFSKFTGVRIIKGIKGLMAPEIHEKMVKVLKVYAPSFPTVYRWDLQFKRGRSNIEGDPRSGRQKIQQH